MNRGCVWCKMRDAILGCMGGQPKRCEKLPKGRNSRRSRSEESSRAGDSERQFVFDDRGLESEVPLTSERRQRGRQFRPRELSVEKSRRGHSYQTRNKKPSSGKTKLDQCTQTFGPFYKKINFGARKKKPQTHHAISYEKGRYQSTYCDFYQRQYQRDLLRRQAERLPLLQYHYEQGRPLRGILKKPQYIRPPRMDELIVVEVCTLHENKKPVL